VLAAATVLVAAATTWAVAMVGADEATSAAAAPVNTEPVRLGELSALVSQDGVLTHRARADGSPYFAINQARGTYTMLPEPGDEVHCGDVLYRVDEVPVMLLCGRVPAYRDLHQGDAGQDVRQLNHHLHQQGSVFTTRTEAALAVLQHHLGFAVTGELGLGDAVFLPEPVRISRVTAELGGIARPGAPVVQATSDTLAVQVELDPSQLGEVKRGDRARITLPGHVSVTGRVDGFGRVVQPDAGQGKSVASATIPAYVGLDRPARARGLDEAPVQVDITTKGVANALSVPVTAVVGRSGGGYAVEVVRDDGRHQLVAVRLGLFDTTAGRVQVQGSLRAGDDVVVPSP
jgi:hypothetical protein